jgi:quercetin dioxygenase-like cupin family protein
MLEQHDQRYGAHYHPTNEVLFLLEGDLTFIDVNQEEIVTVNPGDALFIPAGFVHWVETKSGARYIMGLKNDVPDKEFMHFV